MENLLEMRAGSLEKIVKSREILKSILDDMANVKDKLRQITLEIDNSVIGTPFVEEFGETIMEAKVQAKYLNKTLEEGFESVVAHIEHEHPIYAPLAWG